MRAIDGLLLAEGTGLNRYADLAANLSRGSIEMATVQRWSGREIRALREAKRMSICAFAEHLGISDRMVSKWEAGGDSMIPRPVNQAALDTSLASSDAEVHSRFANAMTTYAAVGREARSSAPERSRVSPGWARRLTELRRARTWSPADLAHELKKMRADLPAVKSLAHMIQMDWESGRHRPGPRYRLLLAAAFDADEYQIFSDDTSEGSSIDYIGRFSRNSVSSTDVAAVEEFTQAFRRLDNKFGGGRTHGLAAQYFDSSVTTMLREGSYTAEVGRELFRAAARLAHLVGWSAYDITDHSSAELYFRHALDFSAAAGDIAFSGEILAAKSHHAIHLRRPKEALALARASQNAAKLAATPALQAEAWALEANAYAVLGNTKACVSALDSAETAFDGARAENTPEWLQYLDEGYLAARFAHCFRDLKDWSQARNFVSRAAGMSNALTRSHAFNVTVLATTYVETDLDQACHVGIQALELAMGIQSARIVDYIRSFQQLLAKHHANDSTVSDFSEQVNYLLGAN
jgi:transcriptional regulator with XRE-family HTH domain